MQDVQQRSPAAPTPPAHPLPPQWHEWYAALRARVDQAMTAHLATLRSDVPGAQRLMQAVAYSCERGGKRARPGLVLECARVCGGSEADALPAALAIEFIHTFSLIHDDLPAMDDDDLRRGQPTNHRVFGEAAAILAGDWLTAHAFAVLAANPLAPEIVRSMVATLAQATQAMVVGQAADMAGEGEPTDPGLVEFIHRNKTAALIEASCRLGALSAGAQDKRLDRLGRFGHHLGLAFQIADDLLDRTSTTEALGKAAGKDAAGAKQTYPAAFGLDRSRELAQREAHAAVAALADFGDVADNLRGLARFVVERQR